jgi:hypothetical protein
MNKEISKSFKHETKRKPIRLRQVLRWKQISNNITQKEGRTQEEIQKAPSKD